MNAKLVNSAAGVIMAALQQNRTAAGIALALDSAQMLMTPETAAELERLASQVVELQSAMSEHRNDAARARRERDLMRERVSEPNGCAHCGVVQRSHGRRYVSGVGGHAWERPSDEQVKARMLARRVARMPLDMAPQPSAEARRNLYAKALYEFVNGAFVWEASDDQDSWLTEADAAIVVADAEQAKLRARVAELEAERHSTNDALADITVAERSADKLTALFAPTQVLREESYAEAATPRVQAMRALLDGQRAAVEDPHDGPLAHSYRVGRDLPETGGTR